MPSVSMRQLLEAGVHFGHQTRRWNPKMRPYIFAERNGIHIIDLAQTVQRLDVALDAVRETVARGDQVLFVGTKKQAQEPVLAEATRADQPYVNKRWLGGMLTNFTTIKKRIGLLEQLEARQAAGDFERMTKKEAAKLTEGDQAPGHRRWDAQDEAPARRDLRDRPAPRAHRGDRGEQARDPGRRHGRHQRGPRRARLHHPRQRRRDPSHPAAVHARRRGRDRGRPGAIDPRGQRARDHRARGHGGSGDDDAAGASDELVAALAGGGALTFEPDTDEDDLLPGDRVARAEAAVAEAAEAAAEATPEEIAAELAREAAEKAEADNPQLNRRRSCPRSPADWDRQTPLRAPDASAHRTGTGAHPPMADILGGAGQGTPRPDRCRVHGLQEGA